MSDADKITQQMVDYALAYVLCVMAAYRGMKPSELCRELAKNAPPLVKVLLEPMANYLEGEEG